MPTAYAFATNSLTPLLRCVDVCYTRFHAAEYAASRRDTTASTPLPTHSPLFKTGYEDYMEKRMAENDSFPGGVSAKPELPAVEPAVAKSAYEEYIASRSSAPSVAYVAPETVAEPPPAKSAYEEYAYSAYEDYLASRTAAPTTVFVEPVEPTVEPAAATSQYEEYMRSRSEAAVIVEPVEQAVEPAVANSPYQEYAQSRSDAPAGTPVSPVADPMTGLGFATRDPEPDVVHFGDWAGLAKKFGIGA